MTIVTPIPSAGRPYPYLQDTKNPPEGIRGHYLSCWAHCLRDALHATGVDDIAARLARPLNFRIEWEDEETLTPYTVYGGLDTDDPPKTHGGLELHLSTVNDPIQGLALIDQELAAGRAVLTRLDVSELPSSRWYRIGFEGYRNTNMVVGRSGDEYIIADKHSSRASGWHNNRGTVSREVLLRCLKDSEVATWTFSPLVEAFSQADALEFATKSIEYMTASDLGCGLGGILDLGDCLLRLRDQPGRQSHQQFRLATPMMALVGDRLVAAQATNGLGLVGLASLLRQSAASWHRVALLIYILARTPVTRVPAAVLQSIETLHTVESEVVQLMRTMTSHQPAADTRQPLHD